MLTDRCLERNADALSRSALMYGEERMKSLALARVAIFGIGGVGGMALEALARTGIGEVDIIDHDIVDVSNINRQLWATIPNIGRPKVDAAADRLKEIDPGLRVNRWRCFVKPEMIHELPFAEYDYVIDAIDNVTGKLAIIAAAKETEVPVISAMGAGNKVDPMRFEVVDIEKTSVCPLARVMRRELRKRGIRGVKVIYSKEPPVAPAVPWTPSPETKKRPPGSVMFGAGAAGLLIAAEVVSDLSGLARTHQE